MFRKNQKNIPPFLRHNVRTPKRPSMTDQLRNWFRRYPALRIAYAEARRRFNDIEGVCGLGVGRKFCESTGQYGAAPVSTGGFCIKVFVNRKKKKVAGKDRIPKWITVTTEGIAKRTRVLLDVVSIGGKSHKRSVGILQQGRGWPEAGRITPGRLFAFGTKSIDKMNGQPFQDDEVKLGTTGAVIHFKDDSHFGISAGHVFTDVDSIDASRPEGRHALGVKGRNWEEVEGTKFFPPTIKTTQWIRDLMLFPIPDSFRPGSSEVTWPDGFLKELATQTDIDRAVLAETPTGFIWVDRKGPRPEAIPVDLEAGSPRLLLPVNCGGVTKWLTYVMTWPLRFTGPLSTICGDSGSPVFLWTEDNSKCRLLGMHFLELNGRAYAMDARAFFREVLQAKLNQDLWLV